MKKITLGKLIGILSFINVVLMQYLHVILPVLFKVSADDLPLKTAYGVFFLVWTCVFGSGTVKKIKDKVKKEGEL
jgi:hypothetical protein